MKPFKIIFSIAITSFLFSCTYEMPEEPALPPPSAGSVNFNKYVAVGDGITAGFMHASLFPEGQENSYPNLLAQKIMDVQDILFSQPILHSPSGNGFNPVYSQPSAGIYIGRLRLTQPSCPQSSITVSITMGDQLTPYTGDKSILTNYGVTGLKVAEFTFTGYGVFNPFFGRFAANPSSSSVLSDVASKQPTFFTFWLGNQDVLGYATAGGIGNIDSLGQIDMTPAGIFQGSLFASLNTLMPANSDVKGVIANIPDVLYWPYFTTVNNSLLSGRKLPFNLSQGLADTLNFFYMQFTGTNPNFSGGTVNYFVIETATGIRQMNPAEDYLLLSLPTDSLGTGPVNPCSPNGMQKPGWGITVPIPNQYVLDKTELGNVRNKLSEYNNFINAEVNTRPNLALADMNGLMQRLNTTGVSAGIGVVRAGIPFGGAISLDGLYPTPKGNAVIANEFIETINKSFGANLHKLDVTKYKGIEIP